MILGFWPKILPVHTYKIKIFCKAYKPIYTQKAEGHQYPPHNRSPSLGPADRSCIKHPKGKRAVHCNFKRKIPQCIAQCPHTNIWQSKFWGEQKTKDEEQKSDAEILLWLFSFFSSLQRHQVGVWVFVVNESASWREKLWRGITGAEFLQDI